MPFQDSENRPPVATSITLPSRSHDGQSSPLQFAFPEASNRPLAVATPPSDDDGKSAASSSLAGTFSSSITDTTTTSTTRRPAVYPHNLAQKQARKFARSAEKRQSIHLLGSIEHLQHHFTKVGIASKVAPNLKSNLQPAVGPLPTTSPTTPTLLPPSPLAPVATERMAYLSTAHVKIDPFELRKEAVESLKAAEGAWKTDEEDRAQFISILYLLKTTVSAIRHVRAYSLELPRSSLGGQLQHSASRRVSESIPNARPHHSISTPSRPAPVPTNTNGHSHSPDPLTPLRKAALDVLTGLRAIEERCRVEGSKVTSDDARISSTCDGSLVVSADTSAFPNNSGVVQIPVAVNWTAEDDRDEAFFFAERGGDVDGETRKPWEERIGSSEEGWLYRDDVTLESLEKEGETLRRYLDVVETVIFPAERAKGHGGRRAWNAECIAASRRRQSGVGRSEGVLVESLEMLNEVEEHTKREDGDAMSVWASENWKGTEMERIYEFLHDHLPLEMCLLLPSPMHDDDFEAHFLNRLSDGYLVILAFNVAIDRATATWGHIAIDDIHDTLEQDTATFRKVANLKCWGASLKLRYGIPLQLPAEPTPMKSIVPLQPSSETAAPDKPPPQRRAISNSQPKVEGIAYDPAIIARKDEGWKELLSVVLRKWVDAVVMEARKEGVV